MLECQENIKKVMDLALYKIVCGISFRCVSFNYIHFFRVATTKQRGGPGEHDNETNAI